MLFYSFEFIFIFLPLSVFVFFALSKKHPEFAEVALILFSLVFYAYYKVDNIFIILSSIVINYGFGTLLTNWGGRFADRNVSRRKAVFYVGVCFNILLLVYFKYTNFIIDNVNVLVGSNITIDTIILPLAISFFTFQQIAYLNDSFSGVADEYKFRRYALFVCFFPQLIAGPIVHHREMMPQFKDLTNKILNWENIYQGLTLFIIGLFKKIVIADTFAQWAIAGYADTGHIQFFEAWRTSLSYSLQLYFDFSGYADMAIGIGLLFNIRLPINFDSPYRALDVQDFWRRWHITLSRFLREYIYFPLGGNRVGEASVYRNLFIVFFVGGIWHGAGWTYVLWGILHGVGICVVRFWKKLGVGIYRPLAWLMTFLFVNMAWVFFRADSMHDAFDVLAGMVGMHGVTVSRTFRWAEQFGANVVDSPFVVSIGLIFILFLVLQDIFFRNSQQWVRHIRAEWKWCMANCALFITAIIVSLQHQRISEFIYWQF
nr:MBOAT family O-acyltransferase [uncultured Pseudodesulfovibrio sp.]